MGEALAGIPPEVERAEQEYIAAWRSGTGRQGAALTGLALSGGGIRSAVFCLGVVQALADAELLQRFDYLSTVSGGGYTGASLTWFTRAGGGCGVRRNDLPYGIDDPTAKRPTNPQGTRLLSFLRRHGSYLNPDGPLSLLPGLAVVLRGVILNLFVIWLPIATCSFAFVRGLLRQLSTVPPWLPTAAVGLLFIAFSVVYSLQTGVQARRHADMPYASRQRFEGIAGWLLFFVALLGLFASLPYARQLLHDAIGGDAQGPVGFAMSAAGAAMGVWSRFTAKRGGGGPPEWAGPAGAALLLYGLALLAYSLSELAFAERCTLPTPGAAGAIAACAVVAVVIGFCVNLNETTLHRFYRDRLMEAFMPDMNGAVPENHNASVADEGRLCRMCDPAAPKAPYHLICAHLVLTRVRAGVGNPRWHDRWRVRGGDSFLFSPRFCGGEAAGWHATAENKALCELSLATAMAISGAAVNPNAATAGVGPQRNAVFAVLMSLLNIRLGYWLPNPRRCDGRSHAPAPNHFLPGVPGVGDWLSPKGRFLEITDGGNFENLGVYELLRRKVRTIVVVDAGADPGTAFADLQNLLGRAEADFLATITFEPPPLGALMPAMQDARFPLDVPFATAPFAQGSIRYADGTPGTLYYLKPAIFAGLRLQVLGFKGADPAFPDDSTLDQFFDEARFEAYRELGFACTKQMLRDSRIGQRLSGM